MTTRVEAALRSAVSDLSELGRSFALLGGFAVSARAEPRTTRDVDLAVRVRDDEDAEQLVYELSQRGYTVRSTIEQTGTGRLATIRTVSPSGVVVDFLFASSGIEPEIVGAAELISVVEGLEVPTATVGHLLATKVLARDDRRRPQDRVDIHALLQVASPDDLSEAREALRLVEARGFSRGRALGEALDEAEQELGDP